MRAVLVGLSRFRLNSRRGVRAGVIALVVTTIAVFLAPTPGMAAGDSYYNECELSFVSCQTGVKVSSASGKCYYASPAYHWTIVCVAFDGDYVYVWDDDPDRRSAMGYIDGGSGSVRTRHCRNPHGANTWARCDFNWSETGTKVVKGGTRVSNTSYSYQYLGEFSGK